MNIRVVVADNQPLLRAGISALLGAEPDIEVVADASTGEEVVKVAAALLPDVVVMELLMADGDGLDVIGKVVSAGCKFSPARPVRVLAMATEHRPRLAYSALRAGAAGFLLKSRSPEVLVGAVRAVAAAGAWLDTTVMDDMLTELSHRPTTGEAVHGLVGRLTAREREVLVLLADGLGNVEISARLFLSEATVRTHIGRILMKLQCRDRTQAVVVAYRSGLVRVPVREQAHAGISA